MLLTGYCCSSRAAIAVEFGSGLLDRDAVFQSGDAADEVAAAIRLARCRSRYGENTSAARSGLISM